MEKILALFQTFTTAYVKQVIRWRYLVVLVMVFATVTLTMQAKSLIVQSDYKYFFEEENAELVAFNQIEETFSKLDSTIIVIQPQSESIASPRILHLVSELTEKSWSMPYTTRVDSISNYQYTRAVGNDLYVSNLIENSAELTPESGREIIDIAMSKPELDLRLISVENNTLAIIVRANIDLGDNDALAEVAFFAENLRQQTLQQYPDLRFAVTGLVQRGYHFYKVPLNDMAVLIPMMVGLLLVVMWLLTRSVACALITIVLVGLSCGAGMGVGALFGIPITTVSAAAPIIILTVAVADSIHILISYLVSRSSGVERNDAIVKSMSLNVQPVLLTTATTIIGFLSLNFSVSPPYQDLGNFAALGTCVAWCLSMTFLPAILAIVPVKISPWVNRQFNAIGFVSTFVLKFKKQLFLMTLLATVITICFLPRLEFNDDYMEYFSKDYTDTQDMVFVSENLSGLYQINLEFNSKETYSIYDPEYLHHLEKFSEWLNQQPEVVNVQSVITVFKNLNRSMHGDNEAFYRIADSADLNAQYLLLYEMSLPYGLDASDQINLDKSATRLDISTVHMKTHDYVRFGQSVERWMVNNLPDYMQVKPVSSTLLFAQIGINNFDSMKLGTLVAFFGIAVCIGLSLTSVKLGVISLFLNVIPFVIAFGLFSMSGQYLGAWTPFVIPTALGLVVDATVHLLSKYHYARKNENLDTIAAINYSFTNVGMALWVSTLVLVLGFSVLAFATTSMLKLLGLGTALILLLALIVDVMVLPVMLVLAEKIKFQRHV